MTNGRPTIMPQAPVTPPNSNSKPSGRDLFAASLPCCQACRSVAGSLALEVEERREALRGAGDLARCDGAGDLVRAGDFDGAGDLVVRAGDLDERGAGDLDLVARGGMKINFVRVTRVGVYRTTRVDALEALQDSAQALRPCFDAGNRRRRAARGHLGTRSAVQLCSMTSAVPNVRKRKGLEIDVSGSRSGLTPDGPAPPALRRLTTPDCMSSPVSHLRDLTRDLEEDGAKRRRAAQYLREWREGHLQQRRLYLVLDLDETLVHSLRASVRQIRGKQQPSQPRPPDDGEAEDDHHEEEPEGNENGSSAPSSRSPSTDGVGPVGPLPSGPLPAAGAAASAGHASSAAGNEATDAWSGEAEAEEVTLQVQNVEFEMKLRPGVHRFLQEMSSLFCVHLYTMGSREYVQQALHHLDPEHKIFKPGQVLAWNPALDRTTKTLQRLLCVPELVLIVDDSPMAWANHLPNLLLIDRFVGSPADNSLERVGQHLKAIHRAYFEQAERAGTLPPRLGSPGASDAPPPSSPRAGTGDESFALPGPAVQATASSDSDAHRCEPPIGPPGRRLPPFATLPAVPEGGGVAASSPSSLARASAERRPPSLPRVSSHTVRGERSSPRSPLMQSSTPPFGPQGAHGYAAAAAALPSSSSQAPSPAPMVVRGASSIEMTRLAAEEAGAPLVVTNASGQGNGRGGHVGPSGSVLGGIEASAALAGAPCDEASAAPSSGAADLTTGVGGGGTANGGQAADERADGEGEEGGQGGAAGAAGAACEGARRGCSKLPPAAPLPPLPGTAQEQPIAPGADVRDLLLAQSASILSGIDCTFAGPSALLVIDGMVPPEVQLARRYGAAVRAEVGLQCTHILVPPTLLAEGSLLCERTNQLLRQARAHKRLETLKVVDARWLLDCVSRWERLDETDYELQLECLVQPSHTLTPAVPTGNPYVPSA